jgi:hypothetical protein
METRQAQATKQFYDLKAKAEVLLDKIEKSIFYNNEQMYQFESLLQSMLSTANQEGLLYFQERLKSIQEKFETFRTKKSYRKNEFNRLYSLLGKLNEGDKLNLISNVYNERQNKTNIDSGEMIVKLVPSFDKYLILQFQESIYVVPNVHKKILNNINYTIKYLSFNRKKVSIFPLAPIKVDLPFPKSESSKLIVLRFIDGYRCVRFDKLLSEEVFDDNELKERMKDSGSRLEDLRSFIVWRGRNCLFLNYTKESYMDSF